MVFITGATGLLGSFICRELLKKGYKVRAVKRASSPMTLLEGIAEQVEWVTGDMSDAVFLEEALDGVESIIHGAAVISFDKRYEKQMYKTNVQGTADLINTCLKTGVTNFVHISSVAALGRKKGQQYIDEDDRWEGTEYDSPYARAKHLQELEVWRGSQEGLQVKIVNPSIILGPGIWGKGSTAVFQYAFDEKKYHPAGTINYVDVRDVARATVELLASDIHGERFVISADSMPYSEFLKAVALEFGKKPPSKPVPYWLLKIVVALEFVRSRLTGKEALITADSARLSRMHYHFKNDKIKEKLGFRFTAFEETVPWAVTALKKMNPLH